MHTPQPPPRHPHGAHALRTGLSQCVWRVRPLVCLPRASLRRACATRLISPIQCATHQRCSRRRPAQVDSRCTHTVRTECNTQICLPSCLRCALARIVLHCGSDLAKLWPKSLPPRSAPGANIAAALSVCNEQVATGEQACPLAQVLFDTHRTCRAPAGELQPLRAVRVLSARLGERRCR